MSLIDSYVCGFVLQEVALPFGPDDDMDQVVDIAPPELISDFPQLTEFTPNTRYHRGYDYGDEYAFDIELVLDGLLALVSERPVER